MKESMTYYGFTTRRIRIDSLSNKFGILALQYVSHQIRFGSIEFHWPLTRTDMYYTNEYHNKRIISNGSRNIKYWWWKLKFYIRTRNRENLSEILAIVRITTLQGNSDTILLESIYQSVIERIKYSLLSKHFYLTSENHSQSSNFTNLEDIYSVVRVFGCTSTLICTNKMLYRISAWSISI